MDREQSCGKLLDLIPRAMGGLRTQSAEQETIVFGHVFVILAAGWTRPGGGREGKHRNSWEVARWIRQGRWGEAGPAKWEVSETARRKAKELCL